LPVEKSFACEFNAVVVTCAFIHEGYRGQNLEKPHPYLISPEKRMKKRFFFNPEHQTAIDNKAAAFRRNCSAKSLLYDATIMQ
jgi:hypothetical protein